MNLRHDSFDRPSLDQRLDLFCSQSAEVFKANHWTWEELRAEGKGHTVKVPGPEDIRKLISDILYKYSNKAFHGTAVLGRFVFNVNVAAMLILVRLSGTTIQLTITCEESSRLKDQARRDELERTDRIDNGITLQVYR